MLGLRAGYIRENLGLCPYEKLQLKYINQYLQVTCRIGPFK